jgi:hypothetical protein
MAYEIIHKNSTAAGTPPTAGEVDVGEIAINAADAVLYTKDTDGALQEFISQFTNTGTGATARTVKSKLQDTVSVKDFGAAGDGATDDTAAIQAALDANPGRSVHFPQGTYLISSTLTIDVTGGGAYTGIAAFIGAGASQTIIDNRSSGAAIKVTAGSGGDFAYNFTVASLRITSGATTAGSMGIELESCRFATIEHVRIDGLDSHGIYGLSTSGDFTDTAQILIRQTEIESCGGYGIYAASDSGGIQYNWNLEQTRVGSCTLGGVLYESLTNASLRSCGIYYNEGFGVKITNRSGESLSKIIHIDQCEFDTNDGVQLQVDNISGLTVTNPYLVANAGLGTDFTKGIVVTAGHGVVINQAAPRLASSLTGLTVIEIGASVVNAAIRDTVYSGYWVLNGDLYNDLSGVALIDDYQNRFAKAQGTYTVQVKNIAATLTSSTTITGYYDVSNDVVTVSFRDLNSINLAGWSASDGITITLPFACATGATAGFIGSMVLTSDSDTATGYPLPVVGNGSDRVLLYRTGSNDYVVAGDLTSGTSSVKHFTITYRK